MYQANTFNSTIDRRAIMLRAWEIFREQYNYPRVGFNSIGRKCLGWAIRAAYAEYRRHVALIARAEAQVQAERASIRRELDMIRYLPGHMNASLRRRELETQLDALSAVA